MATSCDRGRGMGLIRVPRFMRLFTSSVLVLAFGAAGAATNYGPPVMLGDGMARVYVITENDVPIEIGLAVDEAFLAALPAEGHPHGVAMPDGRSTFEYVLELPANHKTPFQHVTLDWNPSGHEPDGVYDLPHLDLHFYVISNSERLAIHPSDPDFGNKAGRLPGPEFMPSGYVDPGAPAVPMMGVHLLDPASPELRGDGAQPFTHTFIYGSWDGRLIFLEPMVTTAHLQAKQQINKTIPVALRYEPSGYYPGAYSITWDEQAREHRIALSNMQWR